MVGHCNPRIEPDDGTGTAAADTGTPAEAAVYVADLTAELALIARSHGLDALGYILEMATLEARNVGRFSNGRR
jgi:hypothetical protein